MASVKQVTIEYHCRTQSDGDFIHYGFVYREAKIDGQPLPNAPSHSQLKLGPYMTRNAAYRSAVKRRKQWARADYAGTSLA